MLWTLLAVYQVLLGHELRASQASHPLLGWGSEGGLGLIGTLLQMPRQSPNLFVGVSAITAAFLGRPSLGSFFLVLRTHGTPSFCIYV